MKGQNGELAPTVLRDVFNFNSYTNYVQSRHSNREDIASTTKRKCRNNRVRILVNTRELWDVIF